MANKWQYPRWRRATMQATMWVVFAATLAAAALVSKQRRGGGHVPLGEERNGVRLPVGWQAQGRDPSDPSVIARVIEPGVDGYGRSITVRVLQTRRPESALTFLHNRGLPIDLVPPGADATDAHEPPRRIHIAGTQGYLTGGPVPDPELGLPRRMYYATAVLPQRVVVLVTLDGLGPVQPDDLDMLERIASSVAIRPGGPTRQTDSPATVQPPVATSGTLALPGGIAVAVPVGFTAEVDSDPFRTGRMLVSPAARVELVPCVLLPNDTDADRATLAELHEPAFHGATVQEVPTAPDENRNARVRQWVIRPPTIGGTEGAAGLPIGAYLMADRATGLAVLAVFRAEPRQPVAFDEAWRAIASGVSFDKIPPGNVPALLAAGERASAVITAGGVRRLVTGASGGEDSGDARQWWLMFGDAPADQLAGWSMQRVTVSPKGWTGTRLVHLRQPDAAASATDPNLVQTGPVVEEWGDTNAMTGYWRITSTPSAAPGAPKQLARVVNGKQFAVETTRRGFARRDVRPLPKNFIPGPWLTMALGGLANEATVKPMLVKTDTFPGCEPALPGGLLTLLIEPDPDAVATRPASEDEPPLRCLRVTINGSGEFARWYFTPDGRPAKIDLAGGMHRKVSDETEVRYNFRDDPAMRPAEDGSE
jgi:hypothetical protein